MSGRAHFSFGGTTPTLGLYVSSTSYQLRYGITNRNIGTASYTGHWTQFIFRYDGKTLDIAMTILHETTKTTTTRYRQVVELDMTSPFYLGSLAGSATTGAWEYKDVILSSDVTDGDIAMDEPATGTATTAIARWQFNGNIRDSISGITWSDTITNIMYSNHGCIEGSQCLVLQPPTDISTTTILTTSSIPYQTLSSRSDSAFWYLGFWFKVVGYSGSSTTSRILTVGGDEIVLYLKDSSLSLSCDNSAQTTSSSVTVTDTDWHLITVFKSRLSIVLAVDGDGSSGISVSSSYSFDTQNITLGSVPWLSGDEQISHTILIDDMMIFPNFVPDSEWRKTATPGHIKPNKWRHCSPENSYCSCDNTIRFGHGSSWVYGNLLTTGVGSVLCTEKSIASLSGGAGYFSYEKTQYYRCTLPVFTTTVNNVTDITYNSMKSCLEQCSSTASCSMCVALCGSYPTDPWVATGFAMLKRCDTYVTTDSCGGVFIKQYPPAVVASYASGTCQCLAEEFHVSENINILADDNTVTETPNTNPIWKHCSNSGEFCTCLNGSSRMESISPEGEVVFSYPSESLSNTYACGNLLFQGSIARSSAAERCSCSGDVHFRRNWEMLEGVLCSASYTVVRHVTVNECKAKCLASQCRSVSYHTDGETSLCRVHSFNQGGESCSPVSSNSSYSNTTYHSWNPIVDNLRSLSKPIIWLPTQRCRSPHVVNLQTKTLEACQEYCYNVEWGCSYVTYDIYSKICYLHEHCSELQQFDVSDDNIISHSLVSVADNEQVGTTVGVHIKQISSVLEYKEMTEIARATLTMNNKKITICKISISSDYVVSVNGNATSISTSLHSPTLIRVSYVMGKLIVYDSSSRDTVIYSQFLPIDDISFVRNHLFQVSAVDGVGDSFSVLIINLTSDKNYATVGEFYNSRRWDFEKSTKDHRILTSGISYVRTAIQGLLAAQVSGIGISEQQTGMELDTFSNGFATDSTLTYGGWVLADSGRLDISLFSLKCYSNRKIGIYVTTEGYLQLDTTISTHAMPSNVWTLITSQRNGTHSILFLNGVAILERNIAAEKAYMCFTINAMEVPQGGGTFLVDDIRLYMDQINSVIWVPQVSSGYTLVAKYLLQDDLLESTGKNMFSSIETVPASGPVDYVEEEGHWGVRVGNLISFLSSDFSTIRIPESYHSIIGLSFGVWYKCSSSCQSADLTVLGLINSESQILIGIDILFDSDIQKHFVSLRVDGDYKNNLNITNRLPNSFKGFNKNEGLVTIERWNLLSLSIVRNTITVVSNGEQVLRFPIPETFYENALANSTAIMIGNIHSNAANSPRFLFRDLQFHLGDYSDSVWHDTVQSSLLIPVVIRTTATNGANGRNNDKLTATPTTKSGYCTSVNWGPVDLASKQYSAFFMCHGTTNIEVTSVMLSKSDNSNPTDIFELKVNGLQFQFVDITSGRHRHGPVSFGLDASSWLYLSPVDDRKCSGREVEIVADDVLDQKGSLYSQNFDFYENEMIANNLNITQPDWDVSIDNDIARLGKGSLRVGTGVGGSIVLYSNLARPEFPRKASFWLRLSAPGGVSPNTESAMIVLSAVNCSATISVSVRASSSGMLFIKISGNSCSNYVTTFATTSVSIDTWFKVELIFPTIAAEHHYGIISSYLLIYIDGLLAGKHPLHSLHQLREIYITPEGSESPSLFVDEFRFCSTDCYDLNVQSTVAFLFKCIKQLNPLFTISCDDQIVLHVLHDRCVSSLNKVTSHQGCVSNSFYSQIGNPSVLKFISFSESIPFCNIRFESLMMRLKLPKPATTIAINGARSTFLYSPKWISTSLCSNNGYLHKYNNQFQCECSTGWVGHYCERNINLLKGISIQHKLLINESQISQTKLRLCSYSTPEGYLCGGDNIILWDNATTVLTTMSEPDNCYSLCMNYSSCTGFEITHTGGSCVFQTGFLHPKDVRFMYSTAQCFRMDTVFSCKQLGSLSEIYSPVVVYKGIMSDVICSRLCTGSCLIFSYSLTHRLCLTTSDDTAELVRETTSTTTVLYNSIKNIVSNGFDEPTKVFVGADCGYSNYCFNKKQMTQPHPLIDPAVATYSWWVRVSDTDDYIFQIRPRIASFSGDEHPTCSWKQSTWHHNAVIPVNEDSYVLGISYTIEHCQLLCDKLGNGIDYNTNRYQYQQYRSSTPQYHRKRSCKSISLTAKNTCIGSRKRYPRRSPQFGSITVLTDFSESENCTDTPTLKKQCQWLTSDQTSLLLPQIVKYSHSITHCELLCTSSTKCVAFSFTDMTEGGYCKIGGYDFRTTNSENSTLFQAVNCTTFDNDVSEHVDEFVRITSKGDLIISASQMMSSKRLFDSDILDDSRWHHLVLVTRGTHILFYVDGQPTSNQLLSHGFNHICIPPNCIITTGGDHQTVTDFSLYDYPLSYYVIRNLLYERHYVLQLITENSQLPIVKIPVSGLLIDSIVIEDSMLNIVTLLEPKKLEHQILKIECGTDESLSSFAVYVSGFGSNPVKKILQNIVTDTTQCSSTVEFNKIIKGDYCIESLPTFLIREGYVYVDNCYPRGNTSVEEITYRPPPYWGSISIVEKVCSLTAHCNGNAESFRSYTDCECICKNGFSGFSCEECDDSTLSYPHCDSTVTFVNNVEIVPGRLLYLTRSDYQHITVKGLTTGITHIGIGTTDCNVKYWSELTKTNRVVTRMDYSGMSLCGMRSDYSYFKISNIKTIPCLNGIPTDGICLCHSSISSGFWSGAMCSYCATGYMGSKCTRKYTCVEAQFFTPYDLSCDRFDAEMDTYSNPTCEMFQ